MQGSLSILVEDGQQRCTKSRRNIHTLRILYPQKVVGARTDFTPEGDTLGDMDEYYGDSVYGDFYTKEMLTQPIQT